jgi:hypothetical protein
MQQRPWGGFSCEHGKVLIIHRVWLTNQLWKVTNIFCVRTETAERGAIWKQKLGFCDAFLSSFTQKHIFHSNLLVGQEVSKQSRLMWKLKAFELISYSWQDREDLLEISLTYFALVHIFKFWNYCSIEYLTGKERNIYTMFCQLAYSATGILLIFSFPKGANCILRGLFFKSLLGQNCLPDSTWLELNQLTSILLK